MMLSDWRINSSAEGRGGGTSSSGVISSPEKKKRTHIHTKERMARVFIEPRARKFREDRLSISLNDRKKNTIRPFNIDYIYLRKIFSATEAAIFSLCHSINAINNMRYAHMFFFFGKFITERIYRTCIIFVCFVQIRLNRILDENLADRVLFIIIYLIICPCTKPRLVNRRLLPDHWTFSAFISNPIQSPSPFIGPRLYRDHNMITIQQRTNGYVTQAIFMESLINVESFSL